MLIRVGEQMGQMLYIFFVHLALQRRAAAVLHHGLWKALGDKAIPAGVIRGTETLLECKDGVRFAALGRVQAISAKPWILATANEFQLCIPILVRSSLALDSDTAKALAMIGLPPDGCRNDTSFDWVDFVYHVRSLEGTTVRPVIDLGENKISVDFFGDEQMITDVASALAGQRNG